MANWIAHSAFLFFFLFFKVFGRHMSFWGPLVLLFWISGAASSGFQSQSGFCHIHFFSEANVMYILWVPPLVLHVPTSWRLAAQPVTSPYASAEVGLGLRLGFTVHFLDLLQWSSYYSCKMIESVALQKKTILYSLYVKQCCIVLLLFSPLLPHIWSRSMIRRQCFQSLCPSVHGGGDQKLKIA